MLKGKITISELSRIINVSRPTLYKYCEEYEKNKFANIPVKIRNLFDYIYSDYSFNRHDILEFCIRNLDRMNDNSIIDEIKSLMSKDETFKNKLRVFIDSYYEDYIKKG